MQLFLLAAIFAAQTPSPEERNAADQRVYHRVDFASKLSIEEGDTLFIERIEKIPEKRIRKRPADYEGLVTGVTGAKSVVVHDRADEVLFEPSGDKLTVIWRYVVHAEPGQSSGTNKLHFTLRLVERTGMVNTISEHKVAQAITVTPARFKLDDLAADFKAYRLYARLTREKLDLLSGKAGMKGLSFNDNGKIAGLDRIGEQTAATVYEFNRFRTRAWAAQRHLAAARGAKDAKIASAAQAYLANLDKADDEISGLPAGAAVATAAPEEKPATSGATLKPERVEEVAPPSAKAKGGAGGASSSMAPVSSYEPGTESDEEEGEPTAEKKAEAKKDKEGSKAVVKPGQKAKEPAPGKQVAEAKEERVRATGNILGGTELLAERELSKEIPIPLTPRALLLDDPNIAYAVGTRIQYATVKGVRGQSAKAPAIFFDGQVAITKALGAELVVPTEFVSVDVQRAQSTYVMGNPIVAAKYRFYLAPVLGHLPVLTVRARWAIPVQPLHAVPPTQLGVEEFTQPAHFVDLSAFLLEKSAFGFGVNGAWTANIIYVGFQMYGDYYTPVSGANDQDSFLALSYGASVGALPFGDLVGFFLEGRATSLFAGPRRTEFFTYLGARGHFADFVEPALWITLPLGSVHDVTGFQFGAGIRFIYDVQDSIVVAKSAAPDRSLQDRGLLQ